VRLKWEDYKFTIPHLHPRPYLKKPKQNKKSTDQLDCWWMSIVLALGRLRQKEDGEFQARLGYVVRQYLKKKITACL
jgi:hypothetical protein